jgi:hypothetical protein
VFDSRAVQLLNSTGVIVKAVFWPVWLLCWDQVVLTLGLFPGTSLGGGRSSWRRGFCSWM